MEEILKENFIESIKSAQKAIYSGCVFAILLFVFAKSKKIEEFQLPEIGISVKGELGLLLVFLAYMAAGSMLIFFLSRANKNLKLINNIEIRRALTAFPSFACGGWYTRIPACALPISMFGVAMQEAFSGNLLVIVFMVFVFSSPYLAAMSMASEIKA